MRNLRSSLVLVALTVLSTGACFAVEVSDEQKHVDFLEAYNGQTVPKRIAAIKKLDGSTDLRSIETLYSVSWRDPDPEVRSRAFYALVHCEDVNGYTANLAAESFKRETEAGVKVEKAAGLGNLNYKWAALNELVNYLHSLRWSQWTATSSAAGSGYIAMGDAPSSDGGAPNVGPKRPAGNPTAGSTYDAWKNREPLRYRTEEELMGLIVNTINRMSGTHMESRPRIDQEIVKWWERKGEGWAEYDRDLRAKSQASARNMKLKDVSEIRDDGVQPTKDAAKEMVAKSVPANNDNAAKSTISARPKLSGPQDE